MEPTEFEQRLKEAFEEGHKRGYERGYDDRGEWESGRGLKHDVIVTGARNEDWMDSETRVRLHSDDHE